MEINENFDIAKQLIEDKKFDQAYHKLLPVAEAGDSRAQYVIGTFYYYGNGVAENHHTAATWFRKSAQQDLVDSQAILGHQYIHGDGIEKNLEKGIELLEIAASKGHCHACFLLGNIYGFTIHGKLDRWKAIEYYKLAINYGSSLAKEYLADIFCENGDYGIALRLYLEAWQEGSMTSAFNAATMFEHGKGCKVNIEMAFKLYLLAANAGVTMAEHNVGAFYFNGKHVEKDVENALFWYLRAAKKDSALSQHCIGMMYLNGDLDQDTLVALSWLEKAAENGYGPSKKFIEDIMALTSGETVLH